MWLCRCERAWAHKLEERIEVAGRDCPRTRKVDRQAEKYGAKQALYEMR